MACPYEAIKWDAAAGVVSKCHFCRQRLEKGREPACVETCFGKALKQELVDRDEPGYDKESPGLTHLPGAGPWIRFVKPKKDEE